MIIVHNKFIKKYFSEKYLGKTPGIFAYLFYTEQYKNYLEKVSKINKELNQFDNPNDLINYLNENYNFSIEKARKFVNKNSTFSWKKGNYIDKKCMLIHIERNGKIALDNLEKTIENLK
jgi:hypothetical protein